MIDLSMREGGIVESLADLPIRLDCLGKSQDMPGVKVRASLLDLLEGWMVTHVG